MEIRQRPAIEDDLPRIVELYGPAEVEQVGLREPWGLADGLADPHWETLKGVLADPDSQLVVGLIDDYVVGFAYGVIEDLLPQAGGERIGVVKMIYVEDDARAVGVGEVMLDGLMRWFRTHGLSRFDAIVSPGHRLAKNFFEAAGFKARRITMYRHDR
jgi:GNAT superfamily N-acetyltransferase